VFEARKDLEPVFQVKYVDVQGKQKYGEDGKPQNEAMVFTRQATIVKPIFFKTTKETLKTPSAVDSKNQPAQGKHPECII
jgi:hypothetical protein